jgi:hypothetical protein
VEFYFFNGHIGDKLPLLQYICGLVVVVVVVVLILSKLLNAKNKNEILFFREQK